MVELFVLLLVSNTLAFCFGMFMQRVIGTENKTEYMRQRHE